MSGHVGGVKLLLIPVTLTLSTYRGNRGRTNRLFRHTRTTCTTNRCDLTGLRVSDVHALCPGTFRIHGTNVGLVRRVSLTRRAGALTCLSDVVAIGRTTLSSVGKGFILRGSATCRRMKGCFCPARIIRGGVNHSFLHTRIDRLKRVSLASVCYTKKDVRRATMGISISSAFTRAPASVSDCRAASLKHPMRGTSCGLNGSKKIVTFLMTGHSGGGVHLRFVNSQGCGAIVRPGSIGTITRLDRLTHILSTVRRVGGRRGRTGLGVGFIGQGVRRGPRRWALFVWAWRVLPWQRSFFVMGITVIHLGFYLHGHE